MRMHRLWLPMLVALVSASFALSGCGGSDVPDSPPSIRGVVTSSQSTDQGGTMRVVWTDDPGVGEQAEYDAAQVAVTKDTQVFRLADGRREDAAFSDIRVGDIVNCWFSGPVAESYPVQAGASHVAVLGRFEGELPEPPGLEAPQ